MVYFDHGVIFPQNYYSLHDAVSRDAFKKVTQLLNNGANIDERDKVLAILGNKYCNLYSMHTSCKIVMDRMEIHHFI